MLRYSVQTDSDGNQLSQGMNHYRLQSLSELQDEHTYSIMYRQSKGLELWDPDRPRVCLRGRDQIKFKKY